MSLTQHLNHLNKVAVLSESTCSMVFRASSVTRNQTARKGSRLQDREDELVRRLSTASSHPPSPTPTPRTPTFPRRVLCQPYGICCDNPLSCSGNPTKILKEQPSQRKFYPAGERDRRNTNLKTRTMLKKQSSSISYLNSKI